MGTAWNTEYPHIEAQPSPKLRLAGRIEMTVDGRPATLIANEDQIVLRSGSVVSLISIWSKSKMFRNTIQTGLEITRLRVVVDLGWFGNVEIFPKTPILLRYFV